MGIRNLETNSNENFKVKESLENTFPSFYDITDDALQQLIDALSNEIIFYRESAKYDLYYQTFTKHATGSSLDDTVQQVNIGRISWYDGSSWQKESDEHYVDRILTFVDNVGQHFTDDYLTTALQSIISASGLDNTYTPEIIVVDFPSFATRWDGSSDWNDGSSFYGASDTSRGYIIEVVIADEDVFDYLNASYDNTYYIQDYIEQFIKRVIPATHNYHINFYTYYDASEHIIRLSSVSNVSDYSDGTYGRFEHSMCDLINNIHPTTFPDPSHWVWTLWNAYLSSC